MITATTTIGAARAWSRRIRELTLCLTLLLACAWTAEAAPTSAAFAGIGIGLQIEEDGAPYRTVVQVLPGGPAARSGIRVGDRIVAILDQSDNPVTLQGMPTSEVVALIRGKSGTTVRIVVEPQGSDRRKLFELVREAIAVQ